MLVLSRRENQVVVIGDGPTEVRITVVKIENGKVRLGITGPRDIPIHRLEVKERIDAEVKASRDNQVVSLPPGNRPN